MMLLSQLAIFVLSMMIMAKASQMVVESSVRVARITRLGEMAVGFLILSVMTSLPELIVSGSAIASENVGISIGNILGSNITNICLLIGLAGILRPTRITEKTLTKITDLLFFCSVVLVMLLISTSPGKITGIALLLLFFFLSAYSVRERVTLGKIRLEDFSKKIPKLKFSVRFYKTLLTLLFGLALLILSSRFVVDSASSIASISGVAEAVIGSTMIAIGTSLPELTITLSALKEGRLSLGFGNTVGSCLTNLTLVLGFTLLLAPFRVDIEVFTTLMAFVLFSTVLLYLFFGRFGRRKLERSEGIILLFVYIIFLMSFVILSPVFSNWSFFRVR